MQALQCTERQALTKYMGKKLSCTFVALGAPGPGSSTHGQFPMASRQRQSRIHLCLLVLLLADDPPSHGSCPASFLWLMPSNSKSTRQLESHVREACLHRFTY